MQNRLTEHFGDDQDQSPWDASPTGDPKKDREVSILLERIAIRADRVSTMRARKHYAASTEELSPYEQLEARRERRRRRILRRLAEYGLRRDRMKLRALLGGVGVFDQ